MLINKLMLSQFSCPTIISNSPTRSIADRKPALGRIRSRTERGAVKGAGGARSRLDDERAARHVVEEGSDAILRRCCLALNTAIVGGGGGGVDKAERIVGE